MTGTYIRGPFNLLKNLTDGNMGVVLTNLAGTEMLLENVASKFEHLVEHIPLVTFMTQQEAAQYLQDNKADWFPADPVNEEISQ